MDAIIVDNLSYRYQPSGEQILKNISFNIKQGESVAIFGLSGCGKSTLCLCLGGIIPHYLGGELTGRVQVSGKDIKDHKVAQLALEVGLVFQDPDTQLFLPTVEDEIAFAPENLCLPPEEVGRRVNDIINLLGLDDFRQRSPGQLSGGQKYLVALGAVLALEPGILVLDEVMAQLDSAGKRKIKNILFNLRCAGKTIVIVEHDQEIFSIADRILVLEEGALIRDGLASELLADEDFLTRHKLLF
ncbi:MAG: Energy-coupling factor transporter ATP-binding protein EcfA1 [Pelotomaculum sp. PtaB.Bin104]|nr:MAG: Energy-coupling factor transporter ATP-binding protein EcfA1 [Pelotomaculum sp. PtaB.Bin104]